MANLRVKSLSSKAALRVDDANPKETIIADAWNPARESDTMYAHATLTNHIRHHDAKDDWHG